MHLFQTLKRKWISFSSKRERKSLDLTPLPSAFQKGGFKNYLPKKLELSIVELEILRQLELKTSWVGEEMLTMRRLQTIRGITPYEHQKYVLESLDRQISLCKGLGISLPKAYLDFFKSADYLNRFRIGDESFFSWVTIMPFPENPDYFFLPFFGDSQGFGWWSILLDKDSNHCIVYNIYHWEEILLPKAIGDNPDSDYYLCSDSFEEFIKRLSIDFRHKEGDLFF